MHMPHLRTTVTTIVLWKAAVSRLVWLLVFMMSVLGLLGSLRLLQMGLLSSFVVCFSRSPTMMRLILSMHVAAALVCSKQRFPGGGGSPFCTILSLLLLAIFSLWLIMLVLCGRQLHGLQLSWLRAVGMVSPGWLHSGVWLPTTILPCAPAGNSCWLV